MSRTWRNLALAFAALAGLAIVAACNQQQTTTSFFDVLLSSASVQSEQGSTQSVTVNVTSNQAFTSDLSLSTSGLPDGVTASFQPPTISGGSGNSVLTLEFGPGAALGESSVTVTGSADGDSDSASFTLEVLASTTRSLPVYHVRTTRITQAQADSVAQDLNILEFNPLTENGTLDLVHPDFQSVPTTSSEIVSDGGEGEGTYRSQFFDFTGLDNYPAPPNEDTARATVEDALQNANLLPSETFSGENFSVSSTTSTSNFQMLRADDGSTAFDFALDRSVTYKFQVAGREGMVPLIGPGAKVKITLARNNPDQVIRGTMIKYSLLALERGDNISAITQAQAVDECTRLYAGANTDASRSLSTAQLEPEASARLVYFAPSVESGANTVYPYYECSGTALVGEEEVLLRKVLIRATDQAPALGASELTTSELVPTKRTESSAAIEPQNLARVDVGVEYIADSQGLPGSTPNAQGFVSTMNNANIPVSFVWSDYNAWEQDFKDPSLGGDDSNWVDFVDAVFYTGHADGNGFTFPGNQDDGKLRFDEARWGQGDLEWLVIAACGPLQPSNSNGNWAQRWGQSFQGLHLLMAYAEVSYVRKNEGSTYAQGLVNGKRVRNAWVDAAMLQPSGVEYAYMGVANSDGQTNYNDYFWGESSGGGPDITNIAFYWKVSGES